MGNVVPALSPATPPCRGERCCRAHLNFWTARSDSVVACPILAAPERRPQTGRPCHVAHCPEIKAHRRDDPLDRLGALSLSNGLRVVHNRKKSRSVVHRTEPVPPRSVTVMRKQGAVLWLRLPRCWTIRSIRRARRADLTGRKKAQKAQKGNRPSSFACHADQKFFYRREHKDRREQVHRSLDPVETRTITSTRTNRIWVPRHCRDRNRFHSHFSLPSSSLHTRAAT